MSRNLRNLSGIPMFLHIDYSAEQGSEQPELMPQSDLLLAGDLTSGATRLN